jgi:hypothetical protein
MMPAMGATRKELENSVNPGADPARQGAAATLQLCSSNGPSARMRGDQGVDYLSNGPQGLKWLLRTRVSARCLGVRGLIEGSIGRGAPDAAGQRGMWVATTLGCSTRRSPPPGRSTCRGVQNRIGTLLLQPARIAWVSLGFGTCSKRNECGKGQRCFRQSRLGRDTSGHLDVSAQAPIGCALFTAAFVA